MVTTSVMSATVMSTFVVTTVMTNVVMFTWVFGSEVLVAMRAGVNALLKAADAEGDAHAWPEADDEQNEAKNP